MRKSWRYDIARIFKDALSSCVGQEYKQQDLLFGRDNISCLTSSGVMGLKEKEESGDFNLLR